MCTTVHNKAMSFPLSLVASITGTHCSSFQCWYTMMISPLISHRVQKGIRYALWDVSVVYFDGRRTKSPFLLSFVLLTMAQAWCFFRCCVASNCICSGWFLCRWYILRYCEWQDAEQERCGEVGTNKAKACDIHNESCGRFPSQHNHLVHLAIDLAVW